MEDLKRKIVAEYSAVNKASGATAAFTRDMDKVGLAMKRMATGALSMLGLGGGIYALERGFRSVINSIMEQEKAERALMAAVGGNISQFKDYASEMQRRTIYGDEEILNEMAYAANLGVTTGQLKEATTAAIGLAARYRIDLSSAMMLVGRASQGQTQMLTRYGIVLNENLTDEQKFNEVLRIGANSIHLAEAETRTATGAFQQMHNALDELKEVMGKDILPVMTDFARSIAITAQEGGALNEFIKEQAGGLAAIIESIEWLDKKRKEMSKGPSLIIPEPKLPPKEWYMKHKEAIPAGIEVYKKAGMIPPEWMWSYIKGAEEANALMDAAKKTHEIFLKQGKDTEGIRLQMEAQNKAQEEAAKGCQQMLNELDFEYEMLGKISEERERAIRLAKFQAEIEKAFGNESERTLEQQLQINELTERYIEKLDKIARGKRGPSAFSEQMQDWYNDATNIWVNLAGIARKSLDSTSDALAEMCLKGKADFRALAESVILDTTRMIIRMQMAQALGFIFPGITGAAFGGAAAIMGGPSSGTYIQNVPGTIGATYQHGGIAERPHLAKIGEVPEAIVPLSGGRSIPVEMRGGGEHTTKVEIHNEGSEKMEISHVESYIISDKRIIDVTLKAMQTNIQYRRNIAQASR